MKAVAAAGLHAEPHRVIGPGVGRDGDRHRNDGLLSGCNAHLLLPKFNFPAMVAGGSKQMDCIAASFQLRQRFRNQTGFVAKDNSHNRLRRLPDHR